MSEPEREGESKVADELEKGEATHRRRNLADVQRHQLEKLMARPEKAVHIPEPPKPLKPKDPPEFVRFYMGSSAGAGSEVFHVYRHLRRKEMIRQDIIQEAAKNEDADLEFHKRVAESKVREEERMAKKRAKRLKKKQRKKVAKETSDDTATETNSSPRNSQETHT